ncbi:L-threonylcarbamoyladenylate synthase [Candidatus Parcubacteria bacterium]|nr:L-threonylcarbamoyladenylate synthase [Candidatus Parcubacteria bacterium]
MEIIKIDLKKEKTWETLKIVDYLRRGKTIAYPTETVYGLGCLANKAAAIKQIHKIKRSPTEKPLIILIKSYCQLHDICYVSVEQDKYIRSIWPKTTRKAQDPEYIHNKQPTTFILRSRGVLPNIVSGNEDSLAVRLPVANTSQNLPKKRFLIKILKKVNTPLISTSLNKHCQKPPVKLSLIENYFAPHAPDLLIDVGRLTKKAASRIIDIRDISNIKVLRK